MINKTKSQYDKKRLTGSLIPRYLKEIFGENIHIRYKEFLALNNIHPLLQKDYGEDNDCTITSLTACLWNKYPNKTPQEIYDIVEACGKKYHFYNGKIYGTINLFIKFIYDAAIKALGGNNKTKVSYFKNIGFNYDKIKQIISTKTPIILSTPNDGRDYYKMHSITIIGYATYIINDKDEYRFLLVYDNWASVISYVDYEKLSSLSNINYM